MLDADTKRRIDTARDILVGKVPDPKSQVEQITIALIYKFMDDIDAESEEWGGERSFFAGEFAQYGWARLMRSGLGGYETLNLYAEAITRMPENPGVPQLFRDIFNNAYLPYRDPETLRAFLKTIDQFSYDHSERLGDAYEYLLSVLGSQGDAGQFRTPRHIIDFIVAVLDPKKHETILDPACGTAGFLISSYKHILAANADEDGRSTLTPDDRGRLAGSFTGYDIDPGMVRLARVNMYLHDFADPHISEYDTLTSEDRWNDYADVVLANPPFMTPKGGIRPHNRFSVKAKRSEVLFVDYMAEHLTPSGRAGIIVPEGIIFQSQKAHKQLRKMLVEDYLVAVVSLPAGVFKPYSGVKTSILILDKSLAKRTDHVAFFKVEDDGFDLGDQRRPIDSNDLPQVQAELTEYLSRLRAGETVVGIAESTAEYTTGEPTDGSQSSLGLIVEKAKVAADGSYGLSAERYRSSGTRSHAFPLVRIGDVCTINPRKNELVGLDSNTRVSFVPMADLNEGRMTFRPIKEKLLSDVLKSYTYFVNNDVLFARVTPCFENGKAGIARGLLNGIGFGSSEFYVLRCREGVLPEWIYFCVTHPIFRDSAVAQMTGTGGLQRVPRDYVAGFEIPLPPLQVQQEIVAEVEAYQRVIDGARTVIDNYHPHIAVDPEWPLVALDQKGIFRVVSGGTPKSGVREYWDGGVPWITLVDLSPDNVVAEITTTERTISEEGLRHSAARMIPASSVVVSSRATIGRIGINRIPLATNQGFKNIIIEDMGRAIPEYVALALTKLVPAMQAQASGATYKEIIKSRFVELQIPLPPLATQQAIVAEVKAEQAMVDANWKLVERMEGRIATAIARVWGEVAVS